MRYGSLLAQNSVAFFYEEVSSVPLNDSQLIRELVLFPFFPANLFEQPFLAEMRRDYGMLVHVVSRYEFVEEPEKLVNLRLREIRVVAGVLHFKSVSVVAFAGHEIWQGAQAGGADWDPNGVVPVFLKKLHKHCFTVEASFTPSAKSDSVIFLYQVFPSKFAPT